MINNTHFVLYHYCCKGRYTVNIHLKYLEKSGNLIVTGEWPPWRKHTNREKDNERNTDNALNAKQSHTATNKTPKPPSQTSLLINFERLCWIIVSSSCNSRQCQTSEYIPKFQCWIFCRWLCLCSYSENMLDAANDTASDAYLGAKNFLKMLNLESLLLLLKIQTFVIVYNVLFVLA